MPNILLFRPMNDLCYDFALCRVILLAVKLVKCYFYYVYCIALLTFHQFQGNKKYEAEENNSILEMLKGFGMKI